MWQYLSPLEGKSIFGEVSHTFQHATHVGGGHQFHLGGPSHDLQISILLYLGKCSEPGDILQYKSLPREGSLHERHDSL